MIVVNFIQYKSAYQFHLKHLYLDLECTISKKYNYYPKNATDPYLILVDDTLQTRLLMAKNVITGDEISNSFSNICLLCERKLLAYLDQRAR
jgi:hypothetical protein